MLVVLSAITMPFILIGRSYCKESKPAIISAALSEWDWLVSPSLWYGEERVYITLWAPSSLQALTAVCLYRGSLSRFMSVLHLHGKMKDCNAAQRGIILFLRRAFELAQTVQRTLLLINVVVLVCDMYNSLCFPSSPLFPCLARSPPSTSSFEALAFREVSLLAGVIPANSSPQ